MKQPKSPQPSPDRIPEGPPQRGPACPTTGGEYVRESSSTVRSLDKDNTAVRRKETGHWVPDATAPNPEAPTE